ncbi:MAG: N2,N2-dimethylguanosine tRNA methyltransferase, partial [uncultured archaeon A07HN63]
CSHVSRHYVRTYLELDRGASRADDLLDSLGYVHHCEDCLAREHEFGWHPESVPETCPNCGSNRVVTAGPIWLGAVADSDFTERVRGHLTDELGERKQADKLLATVAAELDTPTHYDQHRLCKQWGSRPTPWTSFWTRCETLATRRPAHSTAAPRSKLTPK